MAGTTFKCPKCGTSVTIPQPEPARPDKTQAAEPLKQRGAVRDLVDKAAIDGSAPPNVCPGCRTVMPAGAVVCIQCGYNQKLGRKMQTEAGPLRAPRTDGISGAPLGRRARRRRALSLLAKGLSLVYWGVLLACARQAVDLASGLLPMPPVIVQAAVLAGLTASLLQIAGRILCLYVPRESHAAGLILASVVLELIPVLILLLMLSGAAVFDLPPALYAVLGLAASLSGLTAILVFLLFLKRLGRYRERSDLADEAQWLIIAGVVLAGSVLSVSIVVFVLSGTAVGVLFLLPLALAFPFVFLAVIIYLVIRYLRLLRDLHHAVLRASKA